MSKASSPSLMLGAHARWKVCWIGKKKVKVRLRNGSTAIRKKPVIIEREFGNDLSGAIALYTRAKEAGKDQATLVCTNVGFPPPEKYQAKLVTKKKKVNEVKRKVTVRVNPMKVLNRRGITWCPYCREFRRFQMQDGFRYEGHYVADKGAHCPICGISHRNYLVRRYNPEMQVMFYRLEK